MDRARRTRLLLTAIWLCFAIRGAFYSTMFPLWEGFDEYAHVAYIQHLYDNRSLPNLKDTTISLEIEDSLRQAPLPWMMGYLPEPFLTHDAYWKLSPDERALRQSQRSTAQGGMSLYEAQQPPLYYVLSAPLYAAVKEMPLSGRVHVFRLAGVLLASLIVPLGFLIARAALKNDFLAICVTALIAAMPEFMVNLCRVSNEPLALVLATLLLLFTIRNQPLATGVTLGLALLTKAYFLTAIPALVLILIARRRIRPAMLVAAPALLISGWFYWRTWQATGSISGVLQGVALAQKSGLLALIPKVDWLRALDSTFVSHIWFGGWSFLQVRSWMYRVFAVLFLLALAGLLRKRPNPPTAILLVFMAAFATGLAYHVLLTFAANGSPTSGGWYFYAFIAAEATLLASGWLAFHRMILPAATACFTALEVFGTHFYLIPYYSGFTSHQPSGAVPALALAGFRNFGVMLDRLHTPVALWLAFLAATLALIGISFHAARAAK